MNYDAEINLARQVLSKTPDKWPTRSEIARMARALLSTSSAERAMREALEKISAEQWKDRSTVSELNAWPAFQRLNSHVVELYAIADAALTSKEEK